MLGKHPIFAASSTQTISSLSTGEVEFYGAVKCACRTLGLKSLMSDLSLDVKAELVTDSSACKGLCSRRSRKNSTHPLSFVVASTRCGTTSEASFEHGRSASEGLRTWLRRVCTTNFARCSLFPCSLDQALFRLRWMSFSDQRYFFNCSSQFRVTCVKWCGTAGSLIFCNSRCDMCELGTLIFLVLHCLSWKVDKLRIHPV